MVLTGGILGDVGTSITQVIEWVGQVIDALVGAEGALGAIWPLVGISIAISVILFGVKVMRGFTWGM